MGGGGAGSVPAALHNLSHMIAVNECGCAFVARARCVEHPPFLSTLSGKTTQSMPTPIAWRLLILFALPTDGLVMRTRAVQMMAVKGPKGVPAVPFAASYKPAEISALWNTLKKLYEDEDAARQAVQQNNQVLCPLYANPALLTQSKDALVGLLGPAEALEVMKLNPAVLTCGKPGLLKSDPGEIRKTANARRFLDTYATPEGFAVFVLAVLLLNVVYRVATQ